MDYICRVLGVALIVLVSCSNFTYGQDVCVKKSSCICEFSNGTGIDLTPTVTTAFYSANYYNVKQNSTEYELSTYFFHPCYDTPLNVSAKNNTCIGPVALCRHVYTMLLTDSATNTFKMDSEVYDYLGSSNTSDFSADGKSLILSHGPSSTVVLLLCAETTNEFHVFSLDEPNKIVLSFYSPDACLKQIDTGRSFGSTLVIIFFSCTIFYLVLGICTKKFLMGATGIEVIPNLAFWSDLPNLVRDGWAFAINGFKLPARGAGPVTSPDPNSYDSI